MNPYEPDPCYNGITTLRFTLPCGPDNPSMIQWCADPTRDHSVIDGVDLCADVPAPTPAAPPSLPVTGSEPVVAFGASILVLVGAALCVVARRVRTS